MGNGCTRAADGIAHLVTEAEIHAAVQSIEEWQKVQTATVKNGATGQNTFGPLLQRVGGVDVVKKVVELFYRKLYADPRLILFLHDQDVMHLRAKQSAFISWLFGPPNEPYLGRSVRIAHLRIVKQRGFNGDDFDLGMKYFEQAMAELGAPEVIIGEVMRRLRPFKDAFFTPSAKDSEEEARWAAEEREKEEEARQQQLQEQEKEAYHERERQLQEQITLAHKVAAEEEAAEAGMEDAKEWEADAAVAAAVAASLSAGMVTRATTRPSSRGSQCPFTGGRSATISGSGARSVTISGSGSRSATMAQPPDATRPETPPPPPPASAAIVCTPGSNSASASASAPAANSPMVPATYSAISGALSPASPALDAAASSGDNKMEGPQGGMGGSPESFLAGLVSPPSVHLPSTPPARLDAVQAGDVASGSTLRSQSVRAAVAPSAVAAAPSDAAAATASSSSVPLAAAVATHAVPNPDPLVEFADELAELERMGLSGGSGKDNKEDRPLLPPTVESSSSGTQRTALVC